MHSKAKEAVVFSLIALFFISMAFGQSVVPVEPGPPVPTQCPESEGGICANANECLPPNSEYKVPNEQVVPDECLEREQICCIYKDCPDAQGGTCQRTCAPQQQPFTLSDGSIPQECQITNQKCCVSKTGPESGEGNGEEQETKKDKECYFKSQRRGEYIFWFCPKVKDNEFFKCNNSPSFQRALDSCIDHRIVSKNESFDEAKDNCLKLKDKSGQEIACVKDNVRQSLEKYLNDPNLSCKPLPVIDLDKSQEQIAEEFNSYLEGCSCENSGLFVIASDVTEPAQPFSETLYKSGINSCNYFKEQIGSDCVFVLGVNSLEEYRATRSLNKRFKRILVYGHGLKSSLEIATGEETGILTCGEDSSVVFNSCLVGTSNLVGFSGVAAHACLSGAGAIIAVSKSYNVTSLQGQCVFGDYDCYKCLGEGKLEKASCSDHDILWGNARRSIAPHLMAILSSLIGK